MGYLGTNWETMDVSEGSGWRRETWAISNGHAGGQWTAGAGEGMNTTQGINSHGRYPSSMLHWE